MDQVALAFDEFQQTLHAEVQKAYRDSEPAFLLKDRIDGQRQLCLEVTGEDLLDELSLSFSLQGDGASLFAYRRGYLDCISLLRRLTIL